MKYRVFIAINLPENIKKEMVFFQSKWPELPCRWTKKENLHITLEFLGYLTDEELVDLCQRMKKKVSEKKVFTVHLNKICYGPPAKKSQHPASFPCPEKNKTPRMVWVTGEKIKEFNIVPHITLGRIKAWQFKQIESEEIPEINEDIDLIFQVNSIEIMESRLKKGGAEHMILESIPLSN